MATGYLPANHLTFCQSPQTRRLLRDYPELDEFINYMEDVYVGEAATFPLRVWNVYGRDGNNRSNNAVECKNSELL